MGKKLYSIQLENFRAFENFKIFFEDTAFLVGPNNAGKSTILTALRIADLFIAQARSRKPTLRIVDNSRGVSAYEITLKNYPALQESIHFNFEDRTARMVITWDDKSQLVAVWPKSGSDPQDPFFYLLVVKGKNLVQLPNIQKIKEEFKLLGVIPTLSPVEHTEPLISEEHVNRNIATRLSSRHFRNQLYYLNERGEFDSFQDYAREWLSEIELSVPVPRFTDREQVLDSYYHEAGASSKKELVWSGDGIQIWLQILLHVYRAKDSDTVVLDEPEVYLHADLQRRLVRLLEKSEKQIIMATHSAEVIAETSPQNIVMVDKLRKRGLRIKDEDMLENITASVGTSFNLKLVKALRTKTVLFIEGKDMKVLSSVAAILGLTHLEREINIATIPLDGKSNNKHVFPFKALNEQILSNTKQIFVILDRDYETDAQCQELEHEFEKVGITAHIWRRKELESYFLNPDVIARVTGIKVENVREIMLASTEELRPALLGQLAERKEIERKRGLAGNQDAKKRLAKIIEEAQVSLDEQWVDLDSRLQLVPAKSLRKKINQRLQQQGLKPISDMGLVRSHYAHEVPKEMVDILKLIEKECL